MSIQIPSYEHGPMVDKDGNPTETWMLLLTQLLTQLQQTLSNQGFVLPGVSEAVRVKLNGTKNGTMLYNTDTNQMMVNINGTFKNVTVS